MSSQRLGKGFEALFSADPAPSMAKGEPMYVPLARIKPNPYQPRKEFDPAALEELAASIREKGIIQPLIVDRAEEGGFVLIAGERRYRAAKMVGLEEVPVIVRSTPDQERLELALIENIQRSDLNPIEEAQAYRRLMELKGLTQEELAKRLGKQRSTIANALRLLKLPEDIQQKLESGEITAGHARALLSLNNLKDQKKLSEDIVERKLSVREAEKQAEVLRIKEGAVDTKANPEMASLETRLMEILGTKVKIRGSEKGGTIEITYYGQDDLERLLERLGLKP